MATLAQVARQRRTDLRALMREARKVDAVQEKLEREVKRLTVRKTAVPESADAERILGLTIDLDNQITAFSKALASLTASWKSF